MEESLQQIVFLAQHMFIDACKIVAQCDKKLAARWNSYYIDTTKYWLFTMLKENLQARSPWILAQPIFYGVDVKSDKNNIFGTS